MNTHCGYGTVFSLDLAKVCLSFIFRPMQHMSIRDQVSTCTLFVCSHSTDLSMC